MLLGPQFRWLIRTRPLQNVNMFEVRNDVRKANLTTNIVETSNVETGQQLELPAACCRHRCQQRDRIYNEDFMRRRDP